MPLLPEQNERGRDEMEISSKEGEGEKSIRRLLRGGIRLWFFISLIFSFCLPFARLVASFSFLLLLSPSHCLISFLIIHLPSGGDTEQRKEEKKEGRKGEMEEPKGEKKPFLAASCARHWGGGGGEKNFLPEELCATGGEGGRKTRRRQGLPLPFLRAFFSSFLFLGNEDENVPMLIRAENRREEQRKGRRRKHGRKW